MFQSSARHTVPRLHFPLVQHRFSDPDRCRAQTWSLKWRWDLAGLEKLEDWLPLAKSRVETLRLDPCTSHLASLMEKAGEIVPFKRKHWTTIHTAKTTSFGGLDILACFSKFSLLASLSVLILQPTGIPEGNVFGSALKRPFSSRPAGSCQQSSRFTYLGCREYNNTSPTAGLTSTERNSSAWRKWSNNCWALCTWASMSYVCLWAFFASGHWPRSLAKVIDFIQVTRSLAVAIQCYAVLRRQIELPPLTCLHKTGPWLSATISCYRLLALMWKIFSMCLSFLSLSLSRMSFMMMALNAEHNAYKVHSMCCTPMAAQALQAKGRVCSLQ